MVSASRPSGLGMTFLVGGILLSVLATVVMGMAPVTTCPKCEGVHSGIYRNPGRVFESDPPCEVCGDTNKVTLLRRWTYKRNVPAQ